MKVGEQLDSREVFQENEIDDCFEVIVEEFTSCILDNMICEFNSSLESIIYFDEDYFKDLKDLKEIFKNENIRAVQNEIFLKKAINLLIYNDLLGKDLFVENPELKGIFDFLLDHSKAFLVQLMLQNYPFFNYMTSNLFLISSLYLKFLLVNQTLGVDERFSVDSIYLKSYLNLKIHFFELVNIVLSKSSYLNLK